MEKRVIIVIFGPPGAGKGTQAKHLAQRFELIHVSTGDILREEVQRGTTLGKKVQELMEGGELVPDEIVSELVRNRLQRKDGGHGLILDGYPRTVAQAEFLESITKGMAFHAIKIQADRAEIIRRLTGRRTCPGCGKISNIFLSLPEQGCVCQVCGSELEHRPDDREGVISERLRVYIEQTRPLVEFYSSRGKLVTVDGNPSIDSVFESLAEIVKDF